MLMVVEAQGLRIQVCPKLDHLYYNPYSFGNISILFDLEGGVDGFLGLHPRNLT